MSNVTNKIDLFDDPLADLGIDVNTSKKKTKKDDKAHINDPQLEQACQDLIRARGQKKDAEARIARAEAKIIPVAETVREQESSKRGENISTVAVNDMVRVSVPDKYSDVAPEDISKIADTLGDSLGDYIEVETTISLKPEFTQDKDAIRKVIEGLGGGAEPAQLAEGKRKLNEMFSIGKKYKVKSAFHNEFATKVEFREKTRKLLEEKAIKRNKAAILPL